MAKIYVASSWRNLYFPDVVKRLREFGHEVYDFRNPPHNHGAFMWKNVDPDFDKWIRRVLNIRSRMDERSW